MRPGPSHPGTGARTTARMALAATTLLLTLLRPGPATGAETDAAAPGAAPDTSSSPAAQPPRPTFLTGPAEQLTPLARALRERLEAGKRELAGLEAQLAATQDPAAVLDLFRRIRDSKRRTERDLLKTQLEFARADGRAEDAARLAAALDSLATPRLPVPGPSRPAPRPERTVTP